MINFFVNNDILQEEIKFLIRTWAKNTQTDVRFVTDIV